MARTYLVFGDIDGKFDVLRVECARRQRKGRYHVRKLIEKYGRNANMMKWKEQLNGDCPKRDARARISAFSTRGSSVEPHSSLGQRHADRHIICAHWLVVSPDAHVSPTHGARAPVHGERRRPGSHGCRLATARECQHRLHDSMPLPGVISRWP